MIGHINRNRLDKAIKMSDYSLKVIAKKSGITTQMFWHYRHEKYFPSVLTAIAIASTLGEKVEDLWYLEDEKPDI